DGSDAGPVNYFLKIADATSNLALGEIEGADVTITSDYETAAGISKGDLNTQTAFMTGKIKVAGNLAVLMMNQNIIQQWGAAGQSLEIDYA
ncbi:MAG: SCP2 sterol-binding domain-containing protein, partial [Acidimicrobiia bacterium]|nr:SCP2 sterol-binding domain-containing protein [Acidimicrobiia bacterium]